MIYICFQNLLLLWQNEYYSTMIYEDCDTQTKLILLPQKLAPHLLLIREFKMDQEWLYIKQSGLWEIQDGHLALPGSLTNLTFIWWDKAFPGGRFDALAMKKKKKFKMFLPLGYMFYNLQWARHPLHWTNHTSSNKNFTDFLKTITVTAIPSHQARTTEQD